jgi:hydroxypyruvate reductase
MQDESARLRARRIFDAAVARALPSTYLADFLPEPARSGRVYLLGAGKAGASMVQAAEAHYLDTCGIAPDRLRGLAVTRHGYACRTRLAPVIQAGHPVPDLFGLAGTERMLALADEAGAEDTVVVLMSGGASANLIAPAGDLSLTDKRALTTSLLKSGAPIEAMNCVRKHLSRIKGGRLAARLAPATVHTLAISDVPGDDPSVIGSGPTVPDSTTQAEARAILARYGIAMTPAMQQVLTDPAQESPKAGHPVFARGRFDIVLRPAEALATAVSTAAGLGYEVLDLGPDVTGEARQVAATHARLALEALAGGRRLAILSGGELTVTIRGNGRGGPNQEYALALALALGGTRGIVALACDTDGTDGGSGAPTDPAGAIIDHETLRLATRQGLDARSMLDDNDSTRFFTEVNGLVQTGPTLTNANDLRVILVDPDRT